MPEEENLPTPHFIDILLGMVTSEMMCQGAIVLKSYLDNTNDDFEDISLPALAGVIYAHMEQTKLGAA